MNEHIPDAYIEQVQLADTRFAEVGRAVALEADLRDNTAIRALMDAVREDGEKAMRDIAEISPHAVESLSLHLVKIRTLVYIGGVLGNILRRGKIAEANIRAEDQRENGE